MGQDGFVHYAKGQEKGKRSPPEFSLIGRRPSFLQTLVPRCFDVNAFCQRRGFSRVDYCFLRVYSGKEYSLLCVWPGTTLPFCDIAISHINLVQLNANGI